MPRVNHLLLTALIALLFVSPLATIPSVTRAEDAQAFGKDRFWATWARTDKPVANGQVNRTWMWGPAPFSPRLMEPYAEAAGGVRSTQYTDKSRMELNDPGGDQDDPWHVTNGLLVVEMIDGRVQTGRDRFDEPAEPARVPIAGDPDSGSPTYADIAAFDLRDMEARQEGSVITEHLTMTRVESSEQYATYGVTAAVYVPETQHTIASVFWEFMNASGVIFRVDDAAGREGGTQPGALFPDPFYATGFPITEAYWTTARLAGEPTDILWQCFERRCLTYTPDNPAGWRVEAGNVGWHYYGWRYPNGAPMENIDVYLVDLGNQRGVDETIGCDDSLVSIGVRVSATDTPEAGLVAALEALFSARHDEWSNVFANSRLSVERVTLIDGTATVHLTGNLTISGICDDPRVDQQLRQTALQIDGVDDVVFFLDNQPLTRPQVIPMGGIVATFQVDGEPFRVWVTNETTINQILALQAGESEANIPNGRIRRGPGEASHNTPWSWHLDPEEIEMAEVTMELCDGRPTFVQANVDYFVDDVGRYCPWAAELVAVEDHRGQ